MISKGNSCISLEEILEKTNEGEIINHYLGVNNIPCVINSPFRVDNRPSFGLYSNDGKRIFYVDFSTNERGGLFDLLCNMWNCSYIECLNRINNDVPLFKKTEHNIEKRDITISKSSVHHSEGDLQCKIRPWRDYDIIYWESYGVTLQWLKYAEVYPISHKIVIKNGRRYVFNADKYAYAYVEHKEGKQTLKIYQPFNKNGYKWSNKHDFSVISLWTKVPEYGDKICVCSSLKDALCLSANTYIPAIAVKGEGYTMSDTAIKELNRRYKQVYILFDNDEAGLKDGVKLAEHTGFKNIVLPKINDAKDISDLYKSLENKQQFKDIMLDLFK